MPHLSELHGAATHLAVVTIPLYLIVLLVRRAGRGEAVLEPVEPWVLGRAVVGVALAGITRLLVRGQARAELRGSAGTLGTVHFWLGVVVTAIVLVVPAGAGATHAPIDTPSGWSSWAAGCSPWSPCWRRATWAAA